MVQVPPPAGTELPQLFVSAKSPLAVIPAMFRGALPALTSVTVLASLLLFSAWLPKLTCCGFRATAGLSAPSILATKTLLDPPLPA